MTIPNQQRLATEKMQNDFTLFNELTKRFGELRKKGMSVAEVKKANIPDLVFKHTGIKITFGIDPSIQINAYMRPPLIDRNHPFFSSRGFNWPIPTEDRKFITNKKGELNITETWTNDSNYTVGGAWSKVVVEVKLLKGLMKAKKISDGGLAAIFLHELGHVYTYFSLFGKMTRNNFLTAEAIKDTMGSEPLEKRVQALVLLEEGLNIDIKKKEEIAQAPDNIRGELIESIVIAETSIKGGTTSGAEGYDVRNVEQIADQFAIFHGAGGDLAQAMMTIYQSFKTPETLSTKSFVCIELLKTAFMFYVITTMPIVGVILLILSIPGNKVYDDPQARLELMRKQLVGSIKDVKDQPWLHEQILNQIKTIEDMEGLLKDRRTLYTLIYQTISPRGRSMYRQEVYMKSIENLLYNDTYLNAAKFGAINAKS